MVLPKISEQALKEWGTSETCAIKVSMRLRELQAKEKTGRKQGLIWIPFHSAGFFKVQIYNEIPEKSIMEIGF